MSFIYLAISPKRFGLTPLLINGTNAFIIRIANETPSGYAPQTRMITVSTPQPNPKISCPLDDIGDETMSVAINRAPSIKPPVIKWNIGFTN